MPEVFAEIYADAASVLSTGLCKLVIERAKNRCEYWLLPQAVSLHKHEPGFREVDTTARLGGDEFAVILNGVNSREDAVRLAEKILLCFTAPIKINQYTVHVGASMGLCFFPGDANDMDDMLNKVDKALYKAKALGKNQICLHEKVMKNTENQ